MPSLRLLWLLVSLMAASSLVAIVTTTEDLLPRLRSSVLPRIEPLSPRRPRYAFATFLTAAGSLRNPHEPYWTAPGPANSSLDGGRADDGTDDGYYLAARHLVYSLLHHPETRSPAAVVVVLATPSVADDKLRRLRADGAQVLVADPLPLPAWVRPDSPRRGRRDSLTKLRLFALLAGRYDKVCYLDAGTLVAAPLHGVFSDPSTADPLPPRRRPQAVRADEAPLPPRYLFAGRGDVVRRDHPLPPPPNPDLLGAAFFVFRPGAALYEYYLSLLRLEGRFEGRRAPPDEGLLRYAHRRDGCLPWQRLSWRWNTNLATARDLEAGVKSFQGRFWQAEDGHGGGGGGGGGHDDGALREMWRRRVGEMQAYYRGLEDGRKQRWRVGR